MPGTHSPAQSQSETIRRLAGIADTIGAMLGTFHVLQPMGQRDILGICITRADELVEGLASLSDEGLTAQSGAAEKTIEHQAIRDADSSAGTGEFERDLMRESLATLFSHMEWTRSWFGAHEELLRAVPGSNTSRVHDHFIDGVCTARSLAREAGIDIARDAIRNYDWNARPYRYAPEVGPQAPYVLSGTDLGLSDRDPEISFRTPDGSEWIGGVEPVLHIVDLFAEPDRTKLLASAAIHFGLPVEALMGGMA